MISINKSFNSKIILFGEYTVSNGSGALAIPYGGYHGKLDFSLNSKNGQESLLRIKDHIDNESLIKDNFDFTNFDQDIKNGIFFDSNIPFGYGLGSSGALVAAFYNHYGIKNTADLNEVKQILMIMENTFHGSSSGVDPMVSYMNKVVEFTTKGSVKLHENDFSLDGYFMIDTGISRETSSLVHYYKTLIKEKGGFKAAIDHLTLMNQKAIKLFLDRNKPDNLWAEIDEISLVQYEFMQKMIPLEYKSAWKESLDSSHYRFKLCGAGGGGMILGITLDKTKLIHLPFYNQIIFL